MQSHSRKKLIPEINCEAFNKARKAAGYTEAVLANKLCLSSKHIIQIEKNEYAVFFSLQHRHQVAQKIAEYLNLSKEEAFNELIDDSQPIIDQVDVNKNQKQSLLEADVQDENLAHLAEPSHPSYPIKYYFDNFKKAQKYILGALLLGVMGIFIFDVLIINPAVTVTQEEAVEVNRVQESLTTEGVEPKKNLIQSAGACDLNGFEPYLYKGSNPSKPSNYLYVVAKVKSHFCVLDAKNTVTELDLNVDSARSIYGTAPFTFISKRLRDVDIFYQGNKVLGFPENITVIKLLPN